MSFIWELEWVIRKKSKNNNSKYKLSSSLHSQGAWKTDKDCGNTFNMTGMGRMLSADVQQNATMKLCRKRNSLSGRVAVRGRDVNKGLRSVDGVSPISMPVTTLLPQVISTRHKEYAGHTWFLRP